MVLLAPWSLVGLALVPAVLLWGLLAPRGRRVVVGGLMLWRRALGAGPAGRPTARSRLRNPLIWLDTAALTLVILACARPAFETSRSVDPVATVVLDRTASLALHPDRNAGEPLREAPEAILASPVRVVGVPAAGLGEVPAVVALREILDDTREAYRPVLAEGDVYAAAVAAGARRPEEPVLVLTDAAPERPLPENVYVFAPGVRARPAALERVAGRVGDGRWWLLVRAAAQAPGPWALYATAEGEPLRSVPGFLTEAGSVERVFEFAGAGPRELAVELRGPDGSAAPDGRAYLVREEARAIAVLLVGDTAQPLRRALDAAGGVRVFPGDAAEPAPAGLDLVVATRAGLPPGWAKPAVFVEPPAPASPLVPTEGTVGAPWQVSAGHPLADALYLPGPANVTARRYEVTGGDVVVGTRQAPLMVAYETDGARRLAVLFALDREASDWPDRPGFPVFWRRAVRWLVPQGAGEARYVTHRPWSRLPDGSLAPGRPGFYGEGKARIGVSFIGSAESFVSAPAQNDTEAALQALDVARGAAERATLVDLWPLLAGAAVVVLVARAWVAR